MTSSPSSLFTHLASLWRDLSLRSDVDDIVLELLGRFSLDRIYAEAAKEAYQRLVISLLVQLNAVFYLQRLTLPADSNAQVAGRNLGLLVSWDLTVRCVELVLHVVADAREALWESRCLRDKYLAEFLLSALRILTLHPRPVATQRARRERFARIRKSLEQVFDSYPGDKSFLLLVAREVTNQLCADPNALVLPQRLRHELPNLTSELYPLEECLSSQYIAEVVTTSDSLSDSWLYEFLTLRDISHFVVGASIQYAANQETRDVRLQSSSARSRNAILRALDSLRLPAHLPKPDLVAAFNSTFRIILPDTLDLTPDEGGPDDYDDDLDGQLEELDALDALATRLAGRQIIHRVSDGAVMRSMSQVVREIVLHDNPTGHFGTSRPNLHVLNCSECHLVGGAQLRAHDIQVPTNLNGRSCRLPPESACPICGQDVSLAREVSLARRTWDTLRALETDAETLNVQRHLPSTQFQLPPPTLDNDDLLSPGSSGVGGGRRSPHHPHHDHLIIPDPTAPTDSSHTGSQTLFPRPLSPNPHNLNLERERLMSDATSTYIDPSERAPPTPQDLTSPQSSAPSAFGRKQDPYEFVPPRRKSEVAVPTIDSGKPKSRWLRPFAKKPSTPVPPATPRSPPAPAPPTAPVAVHTSGDTSSLSSGALESQRVEEIPLGSLTSGSRAKGRASRVIHTYLSQNSSLALFWSPLSIQIWDVGTSPPTMVRGFTTESTCILAAVSRKYLAYIIGTRDQKLTLRIVNLAQPSTPAVEYRMPSSPWSRSIAIDRNENYVAVGFDESTVRFFKTSSSFSSPGATAEPPREDRLHSPLHDDCRLHQCPPVDTLSFSHDGLALLAATRSARGHIQLYLWRFPFVSFHELTSCRYHVPPHESEDNGVTAAVLQSGSEGYNNLICVTTWTQSGTPVLVQPRGGHRSMIRSDGGAGGRHGKVGNRIQCAAFSPSGQELAIVNDKGILYRISRVNSSPLDISRLATSRELTAKSPSFSMGYVVSRDEHAIVMVWADSAKGTGWIKKIPVASTRANMPGTPGPVYDIATRPDLKTMQRMHFHPTLHQSPEVEEVQMAPVELAAERVVRELDATQLSPMDEGGRRPSGGLPGFTEYKP